MNERFGEIGVVGGERIFDRPTSYRIFPADRIAEGN